MFITNFIEQQNPIYYYALYNSSRRNYEDTIIEWFMNYIKQKNPDINEAFIRPEEYQCWSYNNFAKIYPCEVLRSVKDFLHNKFDVISEDPETKQLSVLREGDKLKGNIYIIRFDN